MKNLKMLVSLGIISVILPACGLFSGDGSANGRPAECKKLVDCANSVNSKTYDGKYGAEGFCWPSSAGQGDCTAARCAELLAAFKQESTYKNAVAASAVCQ